MVANPEKMVDDRAIRNPIHQVLAYRVRTCATNEKIDFVARVNSSIYFKLSYSRQTYEPYRSRITFSLHSQIILFPTN